MREKISQWLWEEQLCQYWCEKAKNHLDAELTAMIDCMVFNDVFNSISVISRQPVHLSMLSLSYLNQYSAHIPSKPLAAFPHNHCRNNGQRRKRNESCRNDYHQSSVLKSATLPTEPLGLTDSHEMTAVKMQYNKYNMIHG